MKPVKAFGDQLALQYHRFRAVASATTVDLFPHAAVAPESVPGEETKYTGAPQYFHCRGK